MADVNQLYQGQFLRAANLGGREHRVVIVAAPAELVGQGERAAQKIVLTLSKQNGSQLKQRLPLNATNAGMLASIFGPQSDNWVGRTILLKPEKTTMQGRYVDCIRTYVPPETLGQAPQVVAAVPAAPLTPVAAPTDGLLDAADDELDDDELL